MSKDLPIADVRPGDQVVLRDINCNFIEGEVVYTKVGQARGSWTITAFNQDLEFARDGANGFGPRMRPGIHLVGHTTQLINEGEDDHGF